MSGPPILKAYERRTVRVALVGLGCWLITMSVYPRTWLPWLVVLGTAAATAIYGAVQRDERLRNRPPEKRS